MALQPEQIQPRAIGCHQASIAEGQQPFARAAQQGPVAMDAQQLALREAFIEEAVLDVGHGQPRQPERVHLRDGGIARDVQHADQLAAGIEDRRRRAIEDAVGGGVMFAAADFDGMPFRDRRADRVGAHPGLVPAGARHQRHAPSLVEEAGAAGRIEDPAVGVGEDRDAAGRRGVAGKHLDLGAREPPEALVLLAHLAQARIADRFDRRTAIGGQAKRAAAPPRLQDCIGKLSHRRAALLEEGSAGMREIGVAGWRRVAHRSASRRCVAICDSAIACCPDTQHGNATPCNDFRCCAAARFLRNACPHARPRDDAPQQHELARGLRQQQYPHRVHIHARSPA